MKILLAEDEVDLSKALVAILSHNGYEVTAVYDGEEAVEEAKSKAFDCMVFDIMMPKKDGIQALTEIRAGGDNTPALFLTAKAEMDDKILGLNAGADDYLTKPFAMQELLARLRSLMRRSNAYHSDQITVGNLVLNTSEQELKSQNAVRLAGPETKLMEILMRNPNKEFTTEELFEKVWKDEQENMDIVWVYISYLRTKLVAVSADLEIIGEEKKSFCLRLK